MIWSIFGHEYFNSKDTDDGPPPDMGMYPDIKGVPKYILRLTFNRGVNDDIFFQLFESMVFGIKRDNESVNPFYKLYAEIVYTDGGFRAEDAPVDIDLENLLGNAFPVIGHGDFDESSLSSRPIDYSDETPDVLISVDSMPSEELIASLRKRVIVFCEFYNTVVNAARHIMFKDYTNPALDKIVAQHQVSLVRIGLAKLELQVTKFMDDEVSPPASPDIGNEKEDPHPASE
jgi:hypothetical protein